ncbi:Uracil-DNA glycosylase [Streptococcus infantarius subsp. infantarius]|nr:Uracil-DNA glycosylase [Streptococcus infantarius subsp. infantarius]
MYDEDDISYTERGIKPLFSALETAQIIIIAQAPGIRAQELGIFFNDLSGNKLREWLGIVENVFMILDILQWSQWIIIFLEKVKRGTYLQEKDLQKNGIRKH